MKTKKIWHFCLICMSAFIFQACTENDSIEPETSMISNKQLECVLGSQSETSPFVYSGNGSMLVNYTADTQYSYCTLEKQAMNTLAYHPRAMILLTPNKDTVYVDDISQLKTYTIKDSEEFLSSEQEGVEFFGYREDYWFAEQNIRFYHAYEKVLPLTINGKSVQIPYLTWEKPRVTVTTAETSVLPNGNHVYDVSVSFILKLCNHGIKSWKDEDVTFVYQYIGIVRC